MNNEARPVAGKGLWVGLIVLITGVALLLHGMDLIIFPWWLFRWPTILIIIGIVVGIRSNFDNNAWLVLVLIGGIFLLRDLDIFGRELWKFAPAIAVIVLGTVIIFRALARGQKNKDQYNKYEVTGYDSASTATDTGTTSAVEGDDYIDLVNVIGGTKRRVFSKHFRGGETVNFFGGTHLDLTQADLAGNAVIDITCVFGGVQLIVPSNWSIESRVTTVLGGLEDKRAPVALQGSPQKRLVLTGVCVFGGIEIKSFV